MTRRNMSLVTLVSLILLPMGVTSATTNPAIVEESPDGVGLWDFTEGSKEWGRSFTFNPPDGLHETEIFSLCEFEGPGSQVAMWNCLNPYVEDVEWSMPGSPGAWTMNIEGENHDDSAAAQDHHNSGPGVLFHEYTFVVTDFIIHDPVDPFGSTAAEGYVYFWAWTSTGWVQSPAMFCETQGASSGDCNVDRNNFFAITPVGPNNCDGILGRVEFWDQDSSVDDRMDISSRTSDAVADIQLTRPASTSPCNQEDDLWWSERGNEDSPAANRCHRVDPGKVCYLTGQYDVTGDNDDASLGFTLFNV